MATIHHNFSRYDNYSIPDASQMRIGIVVSEWNEEITGSLKKGALDTLIQHGAKSENIVVSYVPGSFELIYGAKFLANRSKFDAIIVLGCVVKGDTPHFDYVCSGVTQGIAQLNAEGETPFIFGVLTTENMQQAIDRAGGIHGNKGDEAAITAIKMAYFSCIFK